MSPTPATNANIVRDKKDAYDFIDYHQLMMYVMLNDFIGKSVTVIDNENFTLLNDVVDTEGDTFIKWIQICSIEVELIA